MLALAGLPPLLQVLNVQRFTHERHKILVTVNQLFFSKASHPDLAINFADFGFDELEVTCRVLLCVAAFSTVVLSQAQIESRYCNCNYGQGNSYFAH